MACSTRVYKIILQIINVFYLVVSVTAIGVGVFCIVQANEKPKINSSPITQISKGYTEELGYTIIIASSLLAIFSIFGIYSVAKEKAGKVKVYAIIHVVLLILNVLGLFGSFSINGIIGVVISTAAVFLSFELEYRFRNKDPQTINSV